MRRIFVILAFTLAVSLIIPAVNAMSPFSVDYQTQPSTDPGFGVAKIVASTCGPGASPNPSPGGNVSCTISVGGSGSSGIFGPVVNTILVFGNFFAAAGFLGQLVDGVVVPSYYLTQWLGGFNIAEGLAELVIFIQGLIWFAWADGLMYIISGRDLLG